MTLDARLHLPVAAALREIRARGYATDDEEYVIGCRCVAMTVRDDTGEVVPVDGIVAEGLATVDQQTLTGEAVPAEKGASDRVFASTVVVSGKLFVAVEARGAETAAARIAAILQNTAGHRLSRQATGERLADKAAAPMIALGAVGYATIGPAAAVAIVNADFVRKYSFSTFRCR